SAVTSGLPVRSPLTRLARAARKSASPQWEEANASSRRLGAFRDRRELAQDYRRALQPLGRRRPFLAEHDFDILAYARGGPTLGDVGNQPIRILENIVAESEHCALRPDFDALDISAPAQRFDRHNLQQIFDLVRQRAEAVDEFGGERFDGAVILDLSEAAIER